VLTAIYKQGYLSQEKIMSPNWKKAYSELKDFVTNNQQIEIDKSFVRIPENARLDFYRLFNIVRETFLKEKFQIILEEAAVLSRNYALIASEAKKALGVSEIKLTNELARFLDDPVNGLARSLYDSLFDVLKDKTDIETFEIEAAQFTQNSFNELFKLGYEKWVALSLINLTVPDRPMAVPIAEMKYKFEEPQWDERTGTRDEYVPDIQKLESPYFGRSFEENAYITANVILHSTKLNRYFSIAADLVDATWSARETSDKREWLQLREIGRFYEEINNWPDLVIYIDDKPEDISLVADFSRFCRPDVIVECMERTDFFQNSELGIVKQNYDFFKPKLGSYIVLRLPLPDKTSEELVSKLTGELNQEQPNIHILTVGYDQSKLVPVIDALSSFGNNTSPITDL
jgi:hypothetical protein